MPPSYQADAPFGANIGGVAAAFVVAVPTTAFDSWLTVGITGGDGGGALSSIGLDFNKWTGDTGLSADNAAVFWMSPDDGPTGTVVVAQLTVKPRTFTAKLNAQGRSNSADDWKATGLTFSV